MLKITLLYREKPDDIALLPEEKPRKERRPTWRNVKKSTLVAQTRTHSGQSIAVSTKAVMTHLRTMKLVFKPTTINVLVGVSPQLEL